MAYETKDGVHRLKRASLNAILSSPIHNFKSSLLSAVEYAIQPRNCARIENLTFAGAIGSIQKDSKTATSPFFWDANRKVALIDEYQPDQHGELSQGFLKIMEWEPFARNIAYETLAKKNRRGEVGTYFKVSKGRIEILSKGVFILATMDSPQFLTRSKRGEALADRSLMISYQATNEESDKVLMGELKPEIQVIEPNSQSVLVKSNDVQEILRQYQALFEVQRNPRAFEDMIRAYAVLGYHDSEVYRLIAKTKKPLWRKAEGFDVSVPHNGEISDSEVVRETKAWDDSDEREAIEQ